jgi:hypothetical protein
MITVRWVRVVDPQKPANMKDEIFPTKNEALKAISRVKVSSIIRLPVAGGKLYSVTVGKE